MKNIIVGILLIILGGHLMIHRWKIARQNMEFQNKTFRLHFGEKEIRSTSYLNLFGGILLIILGILSLTGVYELKW